MHFCVKIFVVVRPISLHCLIDPLTHWYRKKSPFRTHWYYTDLHNASPSYLFIYCRIRLQDDMQWWIGFNIWTQTELLGSVHSFLSSKVLRRRHQWNFIVIFIQDNCYHKPAGQEIWNPQESEEVLKELKREMGRIDGADWFSSEGVPQASEDVLSVNGLNELFFTVVQLCNWEVTSRWC